MRFFPITIAAVLFAGCGKAPLPAPPVPASAPAGPSAATPDGAVQALQAAVKRHDGLAIWDSFHSETKRGMAQPTAALFEAAMKSPAMSEAGAKMLDISVDQFRALSAEDFARRNFARMQSDPRNELESLAEFATAKWDKAEVRGDRAEIHGRTPAGKDLWQVLVREGTEWRLHGDEGAKLRDAKEASLPEVEPKSTQEQAWKELRALLLSSDIRSAVLMVSARSKSQISEGIRVKFSTFLLRPEAEQKRLAADVGATLDDFRAMTCKEYVYKALGKIFEKMCGDQEFRDDLTRRTKVESNRLGPVAVVLPLAEDGSRGNPWAFVVEEGEWKLDLMKTMELESKGK